MPIGPVQRYPQGFLELLSLKGISPPQLFADEFRGVLDMLQLWGLSARRTALNNNATAAEAALVSITPGGVGPDPAPCWTLLFAAAATVTVTATMTALTANVILQRGGTLDTQIPLASRTKVGFGATETGAWHVPLLLPYPLLLPPGSIVSANATIIGTDATASVSIRAEFGLLF